MNLSTFWQLISEQKREEILVCCGVNNRIYLCEHCTGGWERPYCDKTNCQPCRRNGSQFPLKNGYLNINEPHAQVLKYEEFNRIPANFREKIKSFILSL